MIGFATETSTLAVKPLWEIWKAYSPHARNLYLPLSHISFCVWLWDEEGSFFYLSMDELWHTISNTSEGCTARSFLICKWLCSCVSRLVTNSHSLGILRWRLRRKCISLCLRKKLMRGYGGKSNRWRTVAADSQTSEYTNSSNLFCRIINTENT